jgi:hypothetical protein
MLVPRFPDELKRQFDEIAHRIGILTSGARAVYSGKYLLVFHFRAPDGYDKYDRQRLRFGIYHAASAEPVLVVAGQHGTDVLEWGPVEEIEEATHYLKMQTVLDELAEI